LWSLQTGLHPSIHSLIPSEVAAMTNLLMNRTRSRLLHFLSKAGPSTIYQISTAMGLSSNTVRRHLARLVSSGCVEVSRNESTQKATVLYFANAGQIQEQNQGPNFALTWVPLQPPYTGAPNLTNHYPAAEPPSATPSR
jgi:predicted transcriptional regulator